MNNRNKKVIEKPEVRQWIATIACCFGMSMAGAAFTWVAPLILLLEGPESPVRMTPAQVSWLSSIVEIGEVVATIPCGYLADKIGRRTILLISGPFSLFSWLLIIITDSFVVLFIARFLQGVVIAIIFTVTPTYIAEISQSNIRGALISMTQVFWNLGIIWIYTTGPHLTFNIFIFACSSMCIIFIPAFSIMPESPYYWIMKENFDKASKSLSWLRGNQDITKEFAELKESVSKEMQQKASCMDLFATKKDRRAFLIVQVVCLVRYMNSLTTIMIYAKHFFNLSETRVSPSTITLLLGLVMLFASVIAVFVADAISRRTLIFSSTVGTAVFNAISATYLYVDIKTKYEVSKHMWIIVVASIGLCITCTVGLGSLMLTVQAEFFPSHTRAIAGGVTEMVAAFGAFINIKSYAFINDHFGIYWNYILYTIITVTGAIIIFKILPETGGKSLQQIGATMNEQKPDGLFSSSDIINYSSINRIK